MIDSKQFRESLNNPKIKNVHAIIDDIKQVAEYIDTQTGDLSQLPENDLVTAIKGLTEAVNELKETIELHVEVIPQGE